MPGPSKRSGERAFKMYIGGKWVGSESDRSFEVTSPASGEVIGTFPKGTAEDAKAAVEAAVRAQGLISRMPLRERARLGGRIAEEIGRSVKEYAVDCSLEHGKPLRESVAEVEDAIPNILWQVEDLKRCASPAQEGFSKEN